MGSLITFPSRPFPRVAENAAKAEAFMTLVGPDGQVELVGELTIRAFIAQAERQLGFMARKANRAAEAA